MQPKLLGLIAGNGKFPIIFAQKAKSQNFTVIAAAIKGDTSVLLRPFVDQMKYFHVGELKGLFDYFQSQGVTDVIMAGQVNPENLFEKNVVLDDDFKKLFEAMKDRKADTIFAAVGDKLKEKNMQLLDSTFLIRDHLAPKGTLTKRGPTVNELGDISFGRDIAKAMGGIDVGQTVVVKDKAIVAIEAMEGTDKTIRRGGEIAREGAVVVKMSKPDQDLRFDVPVIGPGTIKQMQKSRCACLAVEAGKTIIIDRDITVKMANKAGICIVSA
jgi:DUF1009 family protein